MNWEEACKYLWQGRSTGKIYQFKIEDSRLYWAYQDSENWVAWKLVREKLDAPLGSYTQLGENSRASQGDKICRKIKLMEKRWLSFQERKHDVQCRG